MQALTEDQALKLAELLRMRALDIMPDAVIAITPDFSLWMYRQGKRLRIPAPYPEVIDREWRRTFPGTVTLGY